MDIQEFLRLKDDLQKKQRAADRAQGEYDALLQRLHSEYDCPTPEEAEVLLAKYRKRVDKLESEFDKLLTEYQQAYESK